jgi:hypothetical protein
MRFVIENILLFLLPAAVYLTYKLLRENPQRKSTMQVMNEAPLVLLFLVGLSLVAATRIYSATINPGGSPDKHYVPPKMGKDGKIQPGHLE